MTYAYRRHVDQHGHRAIDLFVSELGRPAPAGYVRCSWATFRWAWRLRDARVARRLRGVR